MQGIDWSDQEIRDILRRREAIYKHQPECPSCRSKQVQVMFQQKPARWRCRACKHQFISEPETT